MTVLIAKKKDDSECKQSSILTLIQYYTYCQKATYGKYSSANWPMNYFFDNIKMYTNVKSISDGPIKKNLTKIITFGL
jgi:hypothetical protein